ncbi:MAG TPA: hypothetical protein VH141_15775 [Pseudonocardia sp.]|jgi:uncharacterized membrane protein|nr:hypothetical protein [Pseudonocardia sp.]
MTPADETRPPAPTTTGTPNPARGASVNSAAGPSSAAAAAPDTAAEPDPARTRSGASRPGGRPAARLGGFALALLVALTALTMLLGYANKTRCTGPEFDRTGRSAPDYDVRKDRDLCYSDIQHLWLGRDINEHRFPYLHGGITPAGTLTGGTVEYPVLTGVLMWLGALPAQTDADFLRYSSLLLAPFGLLVGWLLGRLSRWRALIWAVGPPLLLYAFHNWDLPAVACAVAAVAVLHARGGAVDRAELVRRGSWAGVLLGLGFAFKLYPGAFVLPLALYVLTGGPAGSTGSGTGKAARRALDWAGALRVVAASAGTVILVNLPFALLGYRGWRASFTFQELRKVDMTTNSIWYWGFRPYSEPKDVPFQALVDWLSPTLVLLSFALAAGLGWYRYRTGRAVGGYPWVQVSAAMLAGFLLLHKVHSPQYALWLVPFFVLLRIRWGWVAAYLVADLAIGLGIFRLFYAVKSGVGVDVFHDLAAQAVIVGVWGRAALLFALFGVFLGSAPTFRVGGGRGRPTGAPGSGRAGRSAPGEDGLLEVSDPRGAAV